MGKKSLTVALAVVMMFSFTPAVAHANFFTDFLEDLDSFIQNIFGVGDDNINNDTSGLGGFGGLGDDEGRILDSKRQTGTRTNPIDDVCAHDNPRDCVESGRQGNQTLYLDLQDKKFYTGRGRTTGGDSGEYDEEVIITEPPYDPFMPTGDDSSGYPDLIITSFSIPNGTPGQTVNASVTVVNQGNVSTSFSRNNFRIEVAHSGVSMNCNSASDGSATPSALERGASVTVSIPITLPTSQGSYTGSAMADSDCQIDEISENNNTWLTNYIVSTTPPPTIEVPETTGTGNWNPGGNGTGGLNGGSCAANQGSLCTTSQNACGMINFGRIQCNGSCSVSEPPSNDRCPVPGVAISGSLFSPCTITWNATNATSCTMKGPNVDTSGTSGTVVTPRLGTRSNYVLTCYNGPQATAIRTYACLPNPSFQEF